jgi:hypothetical protein
MDYRRKTGFYFLCRIVNSVSPSLRILRNPSVNHFKAVRADPEQPQVRAQPGEDTAMNQHHPSISKESKEDCDESQPLRDNGKIITSESADAVELARQTVIKSRLRRKKRTVIIK